MGPSLSGWRYVLIAATAATSHIADPISTQRSAFIPLSPN
jgi:hypothetical protein